LPEPLGVKVVRGEGVRCIFGHLYGRQTD
jgi:hypothetical protein